MAPPPRTVHRPAPAAAVDSKQMLLTGLAALAVVAVVFAMMSKHGGSTVAQRASGCAGGDVSGSTADVRDQYIDAFRQFATDIGQNGSGKVCLIVAAGDPIAEGLPRWANVGPKKEDKDSPDLAPVEIKQNVDAATRDVAQELNHPTAGVRGSALVEAASVAARLLKPGDKFLWLTDGVQNSPAVGNFQTIDLSDAAIAKLLTHLGDQNLLPSMSGVEVDMPFLLYHPGGMSMNIARQQQVQRFWNAWASRVGATLNTNPMGA